MGFKGIKHTKEHNNKISKALIGIKFTDEHRKNMRKGQLGKKRSIEHRKHMSIVRKGSNNPNWQGGKTSINNKIRQSIEYKLWRESVFIRDNYTCIWCDERGGEIHADHIKPFSLFPELRFSIDNGRTLCINCHKKTETYLNRKTFLER